ncbi:MAG: amidohydrolase family protein [Deltaproteobacteria bacterium]|nr:amidohydrolase family protein [Deltaproteobacteria bacterium]MBV8452921.1 amidohydrolase family protein [Deltaproteobacteria bacterium]
MSGNHHDPAQIHARLNHPVIDSDGHWIEYFPLLLDYIRNVAGDKAAEGMKSGDEIVGRILTMSLEQRRNERRAQQSWWPFPTKNTRDRATAMIPKLLHERMEELGLDFSVLYPTQGLGLYAIRNDEMRQATCCAFNMYIADSFREFADRLTPVAAIPMNTPAEAIAELEHVKQLGLKAIVMGSVFRRPIPAYAGGGHRTAAWYDVLGLDSEYNYDPVWQKCAELGFAPTFHSAGRGIGLRMSPSNFTYNHIGHFASAGEAVCKALFMGGVTRRFPALKFAFLEGGVGWACQLYADLIGHWKKRNYDALAEVNPANLDRPLLREMFKKYAGRNAADKLSEWQSVSEGEESAAAWAARGREVIDDYAACGIQRPEDFRELFARNFYFGCEADDPMNAWGFNTRVNPYGARIKPLFGSDIGHFDVPDMREVLAEAHELVDEGIITPDDFRDFVFTYPAEFWTGANPDFFKGTAVEHQAAGEKREKGGEERVADRK